MYMLVHEGLHVGKGEVHGASNSCLADALLQLLLWHGVVSKPFFENTRSDMKWRCDACLAVRAYLCRHADVTLHPRQRDHTGTVVHDANVEDHALAFLEHHRHGIPIIQFFLEFCGPPTDEARRGFRIVVYSRFDGDVVDPFMDAQVLVVDDCVGLPHIDLRLYNNTGNGISGFHYDPIFLRIVQDAGSARAMKKKKSVDTDGVTPGLKLPRPSQIQSERACDTGASAPRNTSKPSYLQLVSNTRVGEARAFPAPVPDDSAVPDVAQGENLTLVADHYCRATYAVT